MASVRIVGSRSSLSKWSLRLRTASRASTALLLVTVATACGAEGESASRALLELERLSFVPPAERSLPGFGGAYADCSLDTALVVDLYEVTRADWLHYMGAPPGGAQAIWSESSSPAREALSWPACWMTRGEAQDFARVRGMRLLSATEWVHVAVDSAILAYPFGSGAQGARANTLSLELHRPAPVGTFESGRSYGYGCYDLAGNVAEWVTGWLPGFEDPNELPGEGCALGGGYQSRLRRTFGKGREVNTLAFNAVTLDPEHRAADVGLRCAAQAADYLWSHAGDWGRGDRARQRVAAVARGWVRSAGRRPVLRVLESLGARPDPPQGLAWLLEGAR